MAGRIAPIVITGHDGGDGADQKVRVDRFAAIRRNHRIEGQKPTDMHRVADALVDRSNAFSEFRKPCSAERGTRPPRRSVVASAAGMTAPATGRLAATGVTARATG